MDKYKYFFNNYDITKEGIIINKQSKKQSKGYINSTGYKMFTCRYKNKYFAYSIHRLLAIKYIPNPNNYPIVNHIDGNKLNISLDNLEWCSYSHNAKEAVRLGLMNYNNNHRVCKKVIQINKDTKEIIKIYNSITEASKELKINDSTISKCCKGKYKTSGGYIWKYA